MISGRELQQGPPLATRLQTSKLDRMGVSTYDASTSFFGNDSAYGVAGFTFPAKEVLINQGIDDTAISVLF